LGFMLNYRAKLAFRTPFEAVSVRPPPGRAGPPSLRQFAVPYWARAQVFGRSPRDWYRLERSLGRFSLVGTTVQAAERRPRYRVADAKPTPLSGKKAALTTPAGSGCGLGRALALAAVSASARSASGAGSSAHAGRCRGPTCGAHRRYSGLARSSEATPP
jgi:hypothetical protein